MVLITFFCFCFSLLPTQVQAQTGVMTKLKNKITTYKNNKKLLKAASEGDTESVLQLLLEGADVNYSQDESGSVLQAALYNGHPDIAQILLENGADPTLNSAAWASPLVLAAWANSTAIAKLLLANPKVLVNDNGKNFGNYSALDYAIIRGNKDLFSLLLKHGANINNINTHHGSTYMTAVYYHRLWMLEQLYPLLTTSTYFNGEYCEIEGKNYKGHSPLTFATKFKKYDLVALLLKLGDEPLEKNKKGRDSFHYAHGNYRVLQQFEDYGFQPKNKNGLWEAIIKSGCLDL